MCVGFFKQQPGYELPFLADYLDAAGADAALVSSAFMSFFAFACFSCLTCFSVFSTGAAGFVSAAGAVVDTAGVDAEADAEAAVTFAAGADLATLAAAADATGAVFAGALAGVCAKALLPITTVAAMKAVMILFMIFSYSCLGLFACFCLS
jgi:hypothetical protein